MARNSNMSIKTKAGFQLVENTSVTRWRPSKCVLSLIKWKWKAGSCQNNVESVMFWQGCFFFLFKANLYPILKNRLLNISIPSDSLWLEKKPKKADLKRHWRCIQRQETTVSTVQHYRCVSSRGLYEIWTRFYHRYVIDMQLERCHELLSGFFHRFLSPASWKKHGRLTIVLRPSGFWK